MLLVVSTEEESFSASRRHPIGPFRLLYGLWVRPTALFRL